MNWLSIGCSAEIDSIWWLLIHNLLLLNALLHPRGHLAFSRRRTVLIVCVVQLPSWLRRVDFGGSSGHTVTEKR